MNKADTSLAQFRFSASILYGRGPPDKSVAGTDDGVGALPTCTRQLAQGLRQRQGQNATVTAVPGSGWQGNRKASRLTLPTIQKSIKRSPTVSEKAAPNRFHLVFCLPQIQRGG